MAWLADQMGLSGGEMLFAVAVVTLAGIVRGFSGFALSALVMVSLSVILPPVQILPICLVLEVGASLLMMRAGVREADLKTVSGLMVGVVVGVPIGLAVTVTVAPDLSRLIALSLILVLAAAQIGRFSPAWLATKPGLVGSGMVAGAVNGMSNAGGMVIALYMLARQMSPARARASIVVHLVISQMIGLTWLLIFGVMTEAALLRGLCLVVPAMLGVLIGIRLFNPRFEPYYRPFCLWLLLGLAAIGLLRAVTF